MLSAVSLRRLLAVGTVLVSGFAVAQKPPAPPQIVADATVSKDDAAIAQSDVIDLLLTMKTDKNGNISREEFVRLAAAEFDLIARNDKGVVCAAQLVQPDRHPRPKTFVK